MSHFVKKMLWMAGEDNSLDYSLMKNMTEIDDNQAAPAAADAVERQAQNKLVMNIHGYCNKKQKKKERRLLFFDNNDAVLFLIVVAGAFVLLHITGVVYA
eukprot:3708998-Ditylum_brightwellii.AAC.1